MLVFSLQRIDLPDDALSSKSELLFPACQQEGIIIP